MTPKVSNRNRKVQKGNQILARNRCRSGRARAKMSQVKTSPNDATSLRLRHSVFAQRSAPRAPNCKKKPATADPQTKNWTESCPLYRSKLPSGDAQATRQCRVVRTTRTDATTDGRRNTWYEYTSGGAARQVGRAHASIQLSTRSRRRP